MTPPLTAAELREILKGLRFLRGYSENCGEHAHTVRRLRERDRFQHITKELDGLDRLLVSLGERVERDDEARKTLLLWTGVLANLSAEKPQFDNPLVIYEARKIRDEILRLGVDGALEAHTR